MPYLFMGNLVSVIIPTYNRYSYLQKCVQSIQDQTYPNWECIIVDDGSTDETFSYFSDLSARDSRIKIIKNQRSKGAQGARNTGLEHATGDWIAFLDSDNTFHPSKLGACIQVVESNPAIDVVSHFSQLVNSKGERTGSFNWTANGSCFREILSTQAYVDYNQTFVARKAIQAIGMLDEQCPSYQEWDMHIRLSAQKANYFTIEQELNDYLADDSTVRISSNSIREWEGFYYILKKHHAYWVDQGIKDRYARLLIRGIRMSLALKSWPGLALAYRYFRLYPALLYKIFPLLANKLKRKRP